MALRNAMDRVTLVVVEAWLAKHADGTALCWSLGGRND
jgi:hypothetical protein